VDVDVYVVGSGLWLSDRVAMDSPGAEWWLRY